MFPFVTTLSLGEKKSFNLGKINTTTAVIWFIKFVCMCVHACVHECFNYALCIFVQNNYTWYKTESTSVALYLGLLLLLLLLFSFLILTSANWEVQNHVILPEEILEPLQLKFCSKNTYVQYTTLTGYG